MRLWLVVMMALCAVPVSVSSVRAQGEEASPAKAQPASGVSETLKKVEEFLNPNAAKDPALAGEPLASEIADAMHEGAEDHAGSGGLPQFDPTWFASQAFWLLVVFAILYATFARRTLPDISSIIENRKNHIQSDLDQAEDLTSEAESVQAAYEKGLQGARDQAAAMINDIHAGMQAKKNEQSEAFRVKSETQIRAAEERLGVAKDKAMSEISDIVAEVAAQAVEKIIGVPADAKHARTIVNRLSDDKEAA